MGDWVCFRAVLRRAEFTVSAIGFRFLSFIVRQRAPQCRPICLAAKPAEGALTIRNHGAGGPTEKKLRNKCSNVDIHIYDSYCCLQWETVIEKNNATELYGYFHISKRNPPWPHHANSRMASTREHGCHSSTSARQTLLDDHSFLSW